MSSILGHGVVRRGCWRNIVLSATLIAAVAVEERAVAAPTIRLELNGRRLEGRAIAYDNSGLLLQTRDGRLWDIGSDQASNIARASNSFRSFSQSELRGELLREFGDRFDVTGTGHYLVVHPRGEGDLWADRFEQLYRQFVHYFTARGFRPQAPEFPLVAIVCRNQIDFIRMASADGVQVNGNVLGYYSPTTNRVLLFDSRGGARGQDWTTNAETIIHEATHQTAFNTGLHSRMAPQPKWVAEGLATMFEARGVWNSGQYRQLSDRINAYRLQRFRDYVAARHKPGLMEQLISSDRLFEIDAEVAYAQSWAMTFYLAEREPRKYFALLSKLAARPPLQDYSGGHRLNDFRSVFGENLPLLEASMLRFIESLPK
jgi:hypothetical protein